MGTVNLAADVAALEARAAVHEIMILNLVMAVYGEPETGHERMKHVMASMEDWLRHLRATAPAAEKHHAELAWQYFQQMSQKLVLQMDHGRTN